MKKTVLLILCLIGGLLSPVFAQSSEEETNAQTIIEQTVPVPEIPALRRGDAGMTDLSAAAAEAAESLSAPTATSASDHLSLDQVLESGGVLVLVLAGMSVVAGALILYFFFALNTSRVTPASFLRDVEVLLEQGRFDEALKLCEGNRSPAARIVQSAVQYVERVGEPDADLLNQLVEGEGIRQAGRLQAQISYLMDIGVIAPMVGLLGTVMGMLTSFSAVALDIHKARPMELANGVSQALVTTAAGLMVAIPAMVFYSFFRGRLTKLTGSMELAATNVVTILAHRKTDV